MGLTREGEVLLTWDKGGSDVQTMGNSTGFISNRLGKFVGKVINGLHEFGDKMGLNWLLL